jgi:hypothetical protein
MQLQLTELLTKYGPVVLIWFDGLFNQEKYDGGSLTSSTGCNRERSSTIASAYPGIPDARAIHSCGNSHQGRPLQRRRYQRPEETELCCPQRGGFPAVGDVHDHQRHLGVQRRRS